MQLLVFLAEHPGDPLTKEEILENVWPDVFVGEGVLWQSISELRKSLGDNHRDPRFIETIPTKGYRLLADVEWGRSPDLGTQSSLPERPTWAKHSIRMLSILAGSLIGLLLYSFWQAYPGGDSGELITAELFVENEKNLVGLAPRLAVRKGDNISLQVTALTEVRVYAFRVGAGGSPRLIFPSSVFELKNPLAAGSSHRLPGSRLGSDAFWPVNRPGDWQEVILVASLDPLPEFEILPPEHPDGVTRLAPLRAVTAPSLGSLVATASSAENSETLLFDWDKLGSLPNLQVHRLRLAPVSGPVSWWQADGNAADSAGTNHGALVNGVSFAPGRIGQAFHFDGQDDLVDLGNDSSLQPGHRSVSIAAWARADPSGSGKAQIFGNHWTGRTGIWLGLSGESHPQFNGLFRGEGGIIEAPDSLRDGSWHHWVGVIDVEEKEIRLYLDGELAVSDSYQPVPLDSLLDPASHGGHYLIGGYLGFGAESPSGSGVGSPWHGEIDDIFIYDRVLGPDEVANLFTSETCTQQVNLKLDPRASFRYAPAESPQEPPLVVDLKGRGFQSGTTLRITYQAAAPGYSHFNCGGPFESLLIANWIHGIFSQSPEILPHTTLDRVPGAVDAGIHYDTILSTDGAPTDIDFDFPLQKGSGLIKIPEGASYLILGGGEWDNCVPGNISPHYPQGAVDVTIEAQTACQQQ